jgi:hypothetical protein
LAHDTLAPIVIKEIRESDKSGQRALRILTSKINDFKNDNTLLLDEADLAFVEQGKQGMRLWSELEEELITLSIARRAKNRKQRRFRNILGIVAVAFIVGLGVFSFFQSQEANIARKEAETKEQEAITALQKAEKAAADEKRAEFYNLIPRATAILEVGGYPDSIYIQMDRIIVNYPDSASYQTELKQLKQFKPTTNN